MEKILEIQNLKKYFPIKRGFWKKTVGYVKAIDDIDIDMYPGEALGLVGESGSGKTTAGRSILRLIEPTEGRILYRDTDILNLNKEAMRSLRSKMQMIFQDPYASLNPRLRIVKCIAEPLLHHSSISRQEAEDRAYELLLDVGLNEEFGYRFPHQLSGGQRQRVGVARALSLNPDIIIADEPVSALDVLVQAQILNLFMDLKAKYDLTYLFITHDLGVVRHVCDRIAVMYLGKIVEVADTELLFDKPLHPYTEALISAIPTTHDVKRTRVVLEGDIPSPSNVPEGCGFCTRCPKKMDVCERVRPKLTEVDGRKVSCHLYN